MFFISTITHKIKMVKFMIFFTGFLIGAVSLIPGISGGTILVLMKKYDEVSLAISHFKNKENKRLLFRLILGVLLGTITFARIIELLFYFFPTCTLVLFCGLVLFSIPDLIKSEKIKPNLIWFILGTIIIFILSTFNVNESPIIMDYPKLTVLFLITFSLCGMMDGFFTILPGVSGSMIMMILGPYFLYKSYLANLSIQNLIFILPLLCYFLGDIFGFYLGSKVSLYFLKKHRKKFMNFVLGMVVMSALILLPITNLRFSEILLYSIVLLISFIICQFLNLIK